jgi:hypothetical protein
MHTFSEYSSGVYSEDAPRQAVEAFSWLIAHIERTYSEEFVIRAGLRQIEGVYPTVVLQDWAQARLRSPKEYFPDGNYFQ